MPVRYVPILKGKEGEYGAMKALTDDVKTVTMPLVEVPAIPRDWERDRPAKTLEAHVAGVADRLRDAWGDSAMFLDFPWFDDENFADGAPAMDHVLKRCRDHELQIVPVLYRTSSGGHIDAAISHHSKSGGGVCLRLIPADFSYDVEIEQEIDALIGRLGVMPAQTDIVVDLDRITDPDTALLVVRSIRSSLPFIADWRRVVLAASSFPQDLSDVNAASISEIPRVEWQLWERVRRRPDRSLRTDVIYADYAIAHPEPKEMDPRMMRMSASIRYTTPTNWLIFKGRNVRQWGYEQFYELCEDLVAHPEFCGTDYSWGDQHISLCAQRETGTGNATTWRKVATNHHVTLVARQLANPPAP